MNYYETLKQSYIFRTRFCNRNNLCYNVEIKNIDMEKILFRTEKLIDNLDYVTIHKEYLEQVFIIELIKSLPHDKLKELVSFREDIDNDPRKKRFSAEIII